MNEQLTNQALNELAEAVQTEGEAIEYTQESTTQASAPVESATPAEASADISENQDGGPVSDVVAPANHEGNALAPDAETVEAGEASSSEEPASDAGAGEG